MPSNLKLDFDSIFGEIGEFGYQQQKYALTLLTFNVYIAWHMLQYSFVGYSLPFLCETAEQDTPYHNECPANRAAKCTEITFETDGESTVVSEWSLICDSASLGPAVMSVFMFGVLVGALIMGLLADALGRRKTLFYCTVSIMIVNSLSGLSSSFPVYLFLRFVDGFFVSGFILSLFVLLNELVGASYRGMIGTLLQGFFAVGIMLFAVIARVVTHWRPLTHLTSVFAVPVVFLLQALPESPRWLHSVGRSEDALDVIRAIALGNGRKLSDRHINVAGEDRESKGHDNGGKCEDTLVHIFTKDRSLFMCIVIQIFSWFVNSMTYYGLTIAAGGTGDRYYATFMSAFVELFAYAITLVILPKLGRKLTLCGFMVVGGAVLVLLLVLPATDNVVQSVALLSKLCIAGSFAVAYVHSGEIFPTSVRNSAMGVVSMAARAGGILAPLIANMRGSVPNLHLIIFGGFTLISGVVNLKLPETQDEPLPNTIEDLVLKLSMPKSGKATISSRRADIKYKELSSEDLDGFEPILNV